MVRTASTALAVTLLLTVASTPAAAQTESPYLTERVAYVNSQDGTRLAAQFTLPAAGGPHPAIVLLSVAGTDPFLEGLVAEGYAVLAPELRGFVQVEPLLQATFEDLAGDVAAAVAYLRARQGVDGRSIAVVAQGDNTPQAMLYAAHTEVAVPLVLMAPPAFPGTEMFRLEQRWIAESQGGSSVDLDALDAYVREIADIVLAGRTPSDRAFRLQALRTRSTVQLPRNAAFPDDERQMHFFASRLWHDRLAFDPERALGRLHAPALVVIGADDPNTPMDAYLASVRRGLAAARTGDAVECRIAGRTRHTFSLTAVSTIVEWLVPRVGAGSEEGGPRGELAACLEDEAGAPAADLAPTPSVTAAQSQPIPCDGPDADPWVVGFRDRVTSYDELAQFARERHGAPLACEGVVTSEFDGARYGQLVLTFAGGVTVDVETLPIETSIRTLRGPPGFIGEPEARDLLRESALRVGLAIDWSTPEMRTDGDEVVHQFWDPQSGLNASGSIIYRDGEVVGIRVSMAL